MSSKLDPSSSRREATKQAAVTRGRPPAARAVGAGSRPAISSVKSTKPISSSNTPSVIAGTSHEPSRTARPSNTTAGPSKRVIATATAPSSRQTPVNVKDTKAVPTRKSATNVTSQGGKQEPLRRSRQVSTARGPVEPPSSVVNEDILQSAAQAQAWAYMIATLKEQLRKAEQNALRDLEKRERELEAEEADIADSRMRLEAERVLEFYDELDDPQVSEQVPLMVQAFLDIESNCTDVVADSFKISSHAKDDIPHMNEYNGVLHRIDVLQEEIATLESSLLPLSEKMHPGGRLLPIVQGVSQLLQEQTRTMEFARSVVERGKGNARLELEIRSLELAA